MNRPTIRKLKMHRHISIMFTRKNLTVQGPDEITDHLVFSFCLPPACYWMQSIVINFYPNGKYLSFTAVLDVYSEIYKNIRVIRHTQHPKYFQTVLQ